MGSSSDTSRLVHFALITSQLLGYSCTKKVGSDPGGEVARFSI